MKNEYDIIIIGGGPAGLTAGIYTARTKLKSLLIERSTPGGKMAEAVWVENYPGFPEGISGYELSQLMHKQATKYGLETLLATVTEIGVGDKNKIVKTTNGQFSALAVIITGGSERRRLDVPGEKEFTGKGVSYCATCDGPFFQDKEVAVIGGGNAAVSEAMHLTKFATKVTVVHRRDSLRATAILQERALAEPKIEFLWNSKVSSIIGDKFVEGLKVTNTKTDKISNLRLSGVFVSIGLMPNTEYLKSIVPLDDYGHIITNLRMETEIPGIYAAGDIRHNSIRQVIAATGDGAVAAVYAKKYLSE
jgi:thioredoxin reductase (NADPH)